MDNVKTTLRRLQHAGSGDIPSALPGASTFVPGFHVKVTRLVMAIKMMRLHSI